MYCIFVSIDLATQMQYLTNIPESPRLNRASKVLSWISESEDMFEDTGVNEEQRDGCKLSSMYFYWCVLLARMRNGGISSSFVYSVFVSVTTLYLPPKATRQQEPGLGK